jgi:hypothetical protein
MNRGFIGALSMSVAAALIAGCSQSQFAAGPLSQAQAAGHRPATSGSALLYATTASGILMLTYPDGQVYGKIKKDIGLDLCSDPNSGNVYVPSNSVIFEYAHGGKNPIATFALTSNYDLGGCAVNSATGDLAVVNISNNGTNLLVFPAGSGTPKMYTDSNVHNFLFCGYDNQGNLFIDGYPTGGGNPILAELPAGSGTIQAINVGSVEPAGTIQWDGQHITVEDPSPPTIYQLDVSGSTATVVGTTKIRNQTKTKNTPKALTYIYGGTVIASEGKGNKRIGLWNYPQGGKPAEVLNDLLRGKNHFLSFTISP